MDVWRRLQRLHAGHISQLLLQQHRHCSCNQHRCRRHLLGRTSSSAPPTSIRSRTSTRRTLRRTYAQHLCAGRLEGELATDLSTSACAGSMSSPYSDLYNRISNFDPTTQTVLTTTPGAVAGNGITPVSLGGTYGKTLVNPRLQELCPACWLRLRRRSKDRHPRRLRHQLLPITRAPAQGISWASTRHRRSSPPSPKSRPPLLTTALRRCPRRSLPPAPLHPPAMPPRTRATRPPSSLPSTPRRTISPTSPKITRPAT